MAVSAVRCVSCAANPQVQDRLTVSESSLELLDAASDGGQQPTADLACELWRLTPSPHASACAHRVRIDGQTNKRNPLPFGLRFVASRGLA